MRGIAAAKQYGQCAGMSKAKSRWSQRMAHRDSGHLFKILGIDCISAYKRAVAMAWTGAGREFICRAHDSVELM